jgi:hypothetical protein
MTRNRRNISWMQYSPSFNHIYCCKSTFLTSISFLLLISFKPDEWNRYYIITPEHFTRPRRQSLWNGLLLLYLRTFDKAPTVIIVDYIYRGNISELNMMFSTGPDHSLILVYSPYPQQPEYTLVGCSWIFLLAPTLI